MASMHSVTTCSLFYCVIAHASLFALTFCFHKILVRNGTISFSPLFNNVPYSLTKLHLFHISGAAKYLSSG